MILKKFLKNLKHGLEIKPVKWIYEVLQLALLRQPEPLPPPMPPTEGAPVILKDKLPGLREDHGGVSTH